MTDGRLKSDWGLKPLRVDPDSGKMVGSIKGRAKRERVLKDAGRGIRAKSAGGVVA
jgi:hypothetical protein